MPTLQDVLGILADGVLLILAVVAIVRLIGLRSFSKMSAFDFAITIAIGSIVGAVIVGSDQTVVRGALAVAVLLVMQWLLATARQNWEWAAWLLDNQPLLIMRNGRVHAANLARARLTMDDVQAKLREANALDPAQVHAVVFETTGDISVLHGEGPFDEALLHGVRGADAETGVRARFDDLNSDG